MADTPGPFHTILSEGLRPDIVKSEDERQRIQLHVGRFIMTWGRMEMFLGMAIEALASPARHAEFHKIITQLRTAAKIDYLRALLPESWADGEALLNLLTTTNGYRNELAHPVVALSGFYENSGPIGWHLSKLSSGKGPRELTATNMARNELDARILCSAVGVLMQSEYRGEKTAAQMDQHPLSDAIISQPDTWETGEAYTEFCKRVRQIFPHR